MKSSALLLTSVLGLVLSLVVFFGGYLANSNHPTDVLYGSITALGMSLLFGWLSFVVRRTE